MTRTLSIRNLYSKKYEYMPLEGEFARVLGNQTREGAWLFYGAEKNGKTTFALILADYLSRLEKVLYISAEEGLSDTFQHACLRAGIKVSNAKLKCIDYIPLEALTERLRRRKSERIVFIDNLTVYGDELKGRGIWNLLTNFPGTLFIFLAHEKDGEPYTAAAKMCKRLSKVFARIEGLTAILGGRCPGGRLIIDETKAAICFGEQIKAKEYGKEKQEA